MKFEYYVMNYDSNIKKVVPFNIFRNISLNEETEKEVHRYLRYPAKYKYIKYHITANEQDKIFYGFEGFAKCLLSLIKWQEWSRYEYEISVGAPFESDCDKLQKIDCYEQAEPNIYIIAREVLYQARQQMKEKQLI